jgi:hypothetical protein
MNLKGFYRRNGYAKYSMVDSATATSQNSAYTFYFSAHHFTNIRCKELFWEIQKESGGELAKQ